MHYLFSQFDWEGGEEFKVKGTKSDAEGSLTYLHMVEAKQV